MIATAKIYQNQCKIKIKQVKLLKLVLAEIKTNSGVLIRLEMARMHKASRNTLFSLWSLKLEKEFKFS